jgi:hypothetical protein
MMIVAMHFELYMLRGVGVLPGYLATMKLTSVEDGLFIFFCGVPPMPGDCWPTMSTPAITSILSQRQCDRWPVYLSAMHRTLMLR